MTGYFVRGEELPAELDPRYDVVVVPWRSLWQPEDVETLTGYQEAGIAVHVHVPFCYIEPDYTPAPHCAIRAVLDENDGWLLGADGGLVGPDGWKLIDPRSSAVRRGLLDVHLGVLNDAEWMPDGLFLDFLWDRVAWRDEFREWTSEQCAILDEEYRRALYGLATGLTFRMRRAEYAILLYGNGWHRCSVLDATVLENFPKNHPGGVEDKNLDGALTGYYGQDAWERFRQPPMILPADGRDVAYDLPKFRVVEAVAFAEAFCPGAIVFDNSGYVFEVMERLAG